jgi:putative ABC transport system permease protein
MVALLGAMAGCALAYGLLRVFVSIAPQGIVRLQQASLDGRVLAFCVVVSLLCGILIGVAPALSKPEPESLVGRTARTTGRGLLRYTLVTAQIAGSLVLLSSAALLLRSLWKIETVPVGLDAQHVVTAKIVLADYRYPDMPKQLAFFQELEARLNRIPGIAPLAVSNALPPSGRGHATFFAAIDVPGRPRPAEGTGGMVGWILVTPNYFQILGIHMVRGRAFAEQDRALTEHPVILNEALAAKLFPHEDAIGKMMRFTAGDTPGPWRTVIGIAANVKNNGLTAGADPEFYIPWKNDPGTDMSQAYATFRTLLSPETVVPWAREQITQLDPTVPVEFATMRERIAKLTDRPRFEATLLSLFAGIAVLLAALGIYGVVSFFVSERTQEIGIRIAMGATPATIETMVLRNMTRWALLGAGLGMVGSWYCTRLLESLLFQVRPHNPLLLGAALLILLAVVLIATCIPAQRAARVDPVVALRYE